MPPRGAFDWNDLRHFLAVARSGSTLGAARRLGVNQTTVARRIEALEAALGVKLFERARAGSSLTEAGAGMLRHAEAAERSAQSVVDHAAAYARGLAGVVRVTAPETIVNTAVTPSLAEFSRAYPDIRIELIASDRFLDLEQGEADVAIRGAPALPDSNLIARKVMDDPWHLFCSREYGARHGYPRTQAELDGHILIGGDGDFQNLHAMRWMFALAPSAQVHYRANSLTSLMHAVKAGLGIAPLPASYAGLEPEIVCCLGDQLVFDTKAWVLVPSRLRDVPRIRAFVDFLVPHASATLQRLTRRIASQVPPPLEESRTSR
jgi:DNA-binding transcriptional LysR family regulator